MFLKLCVACKCTGFSTPSTLKLATLTRPTIILKASESLSTRQLTLSASSSTRTSVARRVSSPPPPPPPEENLEVLGLFLPEDEYVPYRHPATPRLERFGDAMLYARRRLVHLGRLEIMEASVLDAAIALRGHIEASYKAHGDARLVLVECISIEM